MQRGEKSLNDFKFGTSVGRFPSDGTASTAVKGLMSCQSHRVTSVHWRLGVYQKAFGDRTRFAYRGGRITLVHESSSTSPGY